jgi:hypothetical protein
MRPDMLTRRAVLEPATANDETREVEAIWSTGAGVRRRDAAGMYEERLSLDPKHVDVARLVGAPVLDGHRQESVDRVLGVVVSARVDGGAGYAVLRFSERAEPVWRDVKGGILRQVSVGYSVEKWADSAENGLRVRTATAWTPRELSLVPLAADPNASIRGDVMDHDEKTETRADVNREIRRLTDAAKLDRAIADELIDAESDLDTAKRTLFERLIAKPASIRTQRVEVGETLDAPDKLVERMADALVCRIDGKAPPEAARPYMERRLVDLAAELLQARGERGLRLMSSDAILTRAMHGTSDFPLLLTGVGQRQLQAAFASAPNPLRSLCRATTVVDFRAKSILKLSEAPSLLPVAEHGEVKSGSRSESRESYAIGTYGRIFSLTRQAIINDDLGAFSDFARAAGRAAAELEAGILVDLLVGPGGVGPLLDDGARLFTTGRGNLASSGAAIGSDTLSAARLAMRTMKGLDGVTPIGATPRFLLVGPALETEAEEMLATIAPAETANVNVFSGRLALLVEPRITTSAWWVFCAPSELPVIEYAYLSSAQGPQIASREGFDVLGLELRVIEDFGAGVIDWRGAYLNQGASN